MWKTSYQNSSIVVKTSWVGPTELYINNRLLDKKTAIFSTVLSGKLDDGSVVKVLVNASLFSIHCDIFVNDSLIFSSAKNA